MRTSIYIVATLLVVLWLTTLIGVLKQLFVVLLVVAIVVAWVAGLYHVISKDLK